MLKLSIITINYNNASGLQKTMQSVLEQNFKNYEYIVIDGGSNDGSIDVIKKYADKITYWVSEKDKGIYNAMNKGIQKAQGEYCLFLNSGDFLCSSNVLKKIFVVNGNTDIIYGNMVIDWGNGEKTNGKMPDIIDTQQMYNDTLWHPVSFIKRTLFEKYGLYDESYKIVADYDFFFKTIITKKVSTKHVSVFVSEYNADGFSSRTENKILEREERKKVIYSYLSEETINHMESLKRISTKKSFSLKYFFKKRF